MRGHGEASRDEFFYGSDFPGYQPLPSTRYEPGRIIVKLRAGRDYHAEVEGTRYSVPSRFAGKLLNAKVTMASIHLFDEGRIIATHPRQDNADQLVTTSAHLPEAHKSAALTRLAGMKRFVAEIGPCAEALIDCHFRISRKPALTATAAINLRALTEHYTVERVEKACKIAIAIEKANVRKVVAILVAGLDAEEPGELVQITPEAQKNIRGASYFSELVSTAWGESNDV